MADYVSLIETRLILAHIHRVRSVFGQAAVLAADLAITWLIIWAAIFAYVQSPLHDGDPLSFAETLGVFTVYSVFFYSAFLTSVWTWAFILFAWMLRLVRRLPLARILDVENRPVHIVAYGLGLVVFLGGTLLAYPLRKDEDGLSMADRALCSVFRRKVCPAVAELTPVQRAQLDLILLACEGGLTGPCLERGLATYELQPADAARLWRTACDGGNARGCFNLGFLHERGIGMDPDPAEAARLYRQGCEMGDCLGCTEARRLAGE